MNTIGKILVILNFLFAVIVGLFLVIYIAAQNRYREANEETIRQAKIMKESYETTKRSMDLILAEYRDGQLKLEKITQDLYDTNKKAEAQEDIFKFKLQEKDNMLKDKDITVNQTREASQRLTNEIAVLNTNIKDRENAIVRLEADIKKLRVDAVQFEALARTRQIQNENLTERLRELTLALTRERTGAVNPDVMVVRNPNDPNPPSAQVNGKIEKVDIDLVQLSVGTDHGLNKNNTLDVYRLTPEPKYLGMIRIVDANHHQSIGRLIPTGNAQFRPQLKVGDMVTSKLTK